ncbi:MAG TPA: hypothetical protein VLX92_06485 [Kofleriaceae bacterium]|nr:hypothetical protein [Kofleriaceae bacterium]
MADLIRPTRAIVALSLAACGARPDAALDGGMIDARGVDTSSIDASASGVPTYGDARQLVTAPASIEGDFGLVVAVSADGSTLATCGIDASSGMVVVIVYARGEAGFGATPVQILSPPAATPYWGSGGLSLSSDGAVLVVGAEDPAGHGEVLVYARSGAGFATAPAQTIALPVGPAVWTNALSADGNTLAVTSSAGGGVYVYRRTGTSFAAAPAQTIAPPPASSSFFGVSGGVATDGALLAISDTGVGRGAVAVYAASGGGFATSPTASLPAPAGVSSFGDCVAVRPDGNELVESGDQPPHIQVYGPSASGFDLAQMLELPAGAPGNLLPSVAVTADGTLFVGAAAMSRIYVYAASADAQLNHSR